MTRVPIQLTDGASNMISVADSGLWDLFVGKASNVGFLRPLMWPPYRLVMDLSGGAYFAWFKGIHVAQVLVLLALLLRWLRVKTATDVVAFAFGVAVLVGGHTFVGTVREAYPINHFLAIAICVTGVAVLAAEPHRGLNDALAVLLFVYAALTLESGLLVWVASVAAYVLGWRGISGRALAVLSAAVAAYFAARFGWFHNGTPALLERTSGFGFGMLGPDEIQQRFGDRPLVFYAYNVCAAVLTQLVAEPRGGVYRFVRGVVAGPVEPWTVVNVVAASGATVLVSVAAWTRRARWRYGLTHEDRVLLMWPVLLLANAVFCYAYVKDVVLSAAGVFAAAAAAVAMREVLNRASAWSLRPGPIAATILLAALSSAWAVKFIGVHYSIRKEAISVRKEWAWVDQWLERQEIVLDTPAKRGVKARLESAALTSDPAPPWPSLPVPPSWFDEIQ